MKLLYFLSHKIFCIIESIIVDKRVRKQKADDKLLDDIYDLMESAMLKVIYQSHFCGGVLGIFGLCVNAVMYLNIRKTYFVSLLVLWGVLLRLYCRPDLRQRR